MAKVSIMRMLMVFTATVMLLDVATAVDHVVGAPNGGWDLSTDLQTWASSQTFSVGDNLVFQFDSSHDVLEVNSANFGSCGTANSISASENSPTRFALTAVGSRYFVCGRGNHCNQGMKVQIDVVAAATPSPPTTTPSPPTTTPSPPQTTTPSSPTPPSNGPTPPTRGVTVEPPSSAMTLKMTVGSVVGFVFLVMMLLTL